MLNRIALLAAATIAGAALLVGGVASQTLRRQVAVRFTPGPGIWGALTPDAHGHPASPFRTVWSHIVKLGGPIIHGIPENSLNARVAVLSCDAAFEGSTTSPQEFETMRFTVMNETPYFLRYTRVAVEVDRGASYEDAILFDLKPYELRSFVLTQGGAASDGNLPEYHHYPKWMLCGAGPAQRANGQMLDFEPGFFNPKGEQTKLVLPGKP